MRILLVLFCVACFGCIGAWAQSPVEVVQKQLDAYNKQDTIAFAACFAEDVQLYNKLGDSVPALRGRASLHQRYAALFAKYPANRSTLLGRMVHGTFVIDHEWITGRETEMKLVAVYEVEDGLIQRCWFIR